MPGRHQVVQGRLDVQVQPAFGPPQLGRVHQRGVTAGPDGQAHQGIAEVTGTGDRHLGRRGQPRPGQAGPPRRGRLPHQIVPQRAPADLEPGHRVTSSLAGGRSGVAAAPAAARAGAARGARWRSRAVPPQHERRGGGFPARCWRPVAGSVPGDLHERLLQCSLPGLQRGWPCARCAGEFPDQLRKRTPDWLVLGG